MTFSIPLTFHNTTSLDGQGCRSSSQITAIESTLVRSKQTTFKAWTNNGDESGIAIGCEDGTIYIFRGMAPDEVPVEKRKKRSQSRLQPRPSRPSSPGLPNPLSPTFAVAPRAQVVLGVSTEQAQAPRNYVDFDNEPERLKDILKGKNPRERERVSPDSASLVTITPAPSTIFEESPRAHRKASSAMSLLSVDSSSTRPPSPSLPPSPRTNTPHGLWLRCHIVPMHAGHGHAVRSLELLEGNTLLVALHESGYLAIYSSSDGHCLASAVASDYCGDHTSRDVWAWCSLQVAVVDEAQLLLVTAATDSSTLAATPDMDENSVEKSQTVLLKISFSSDDVRIESMSHCSVEGPARGVGVYHEKDGSSTLFYINSQGHFLLRTIRFPVSPSISSSPDTPPVAESESITSLAVPLAKSFKSMVGRSADTLSINQSAAPTPPPPPSGITLNEAVDVGILISDSTITGLSARSVDGKLYAIVWAHHEMTVFEYHSFALRIIMQTAVEDLRNVEWLDDVTYVLSYENHIDVFRLECTNADGDHIHHGLEDHEGSLYSPSRIRRISTHTHFSSSYSLSTELIVSRTDPKGYSQIVTYKVDSPSSDKPQDGSVLLWQSSIRNEDLASSVFQTSSVPLELEVIIQGFSDGRIRQYSLEQMAFKTGQPVSAIKQSEPAVPGAIVGLHIALNPRTKEKYILGGADDGSILFWNLSTFALCARWMVFSTPLIRAVEFQESAGPLRGCVLCIAQDGTVAVIAVDGFQFLYMIPGAPSPLLRVSLGESNLVLIYGGNIVRLWDVRTKEFWRSTTVDRAEEMFKQGGWTSLDIDSGASIPASLWTTVAPAFDGTDAAATLEFALDKFVVECVSLTKTISTSRDEVRSVLHALGHLRYVLSIMITPGLNSDVDSICNGKLQLHASSAGVGLSSPGTTTIYSAARPHDAWTISGNVSAARMLAIVFVLKALSLFEELSEAANTVVAFYTLSLQACVGSQYAAPSLEWLGKRWFASAPDLRQSIRTVFDATLAHTSDQDAMRLAEKWQQHLPSLLPLVEQEGEIAALALIICGSIATEKFTLLSISALTDISKSLTLYLHDEKSTHRALAIELCSKGFHVWQHYVDTMDILRALFTLATNVRKESITPQNLSAQARIAVINIATNHTPLFMSTLCLDVLSPPTLDHRRAVMQIIAFLIRKRRHILQPNLPRLMEAVVKSLDPNSNADREAVLATATEIIAFVVKNFPSVDFHMNSQRLAVGTNEGAVVMYDLKTAIRLYVLEGHKRQLTACSFSPDGRRLVTLSLAEQAVLVWKVGSSFSSFFNPGAPPRQGHGGSDPFKTLNFNIGDEVMTVEETLDLVKLEWVADRSVKVKIRDSILTFST